MRRAVWTRRSLGGGGQAGQKVRGDSCGEEIEWCARRESNLTVVIEGEVQA